MLAQTMLTPATQYVAGVLGRIADASVCIQDRLRQALNVCCAVAKHPEARQSVWVRMLHKIAHSMASLLPSLTHAFESLLCWAMT